jgi:hypothetical protein
MRAVRALGAVVVTLAAMLAPLPALACSINLPASGTLRNSMSNTVLGSQVNGNTPATVTMVLPLLSGVSVTVNAPTIAQSPSGYNPALETREVAYTAAVIGLIQLANQGYTTTTTNFSTGLLGAVTLTMTMHNRVNNPNGFAPGTYTTRTVVTCHP